jgi:hypothetical protein
MAAQITLPGRTGALDVPDPGWATSYPPPARRSVYAAAHLGDGFIDFRAISAQVLAAG